MLRLKIAGSKVKGTFVIPATGEAEAGGFSDLKRFEASLGKILFPRGQKYKLIAYTEGEKDLFRNVKRKLFHLLQLGWICRTLCQAK